MRLVYLLVEGPTEVSFVDRLLTCHLQNLLLQPIKVTTRAEGARPAKGGSVAYESFKRQIQNILKDPRAAMVTTMLDYQGLNMEFPGRRDCTETTAGQRAVAVEAAMKADLEDPRYEPFVLMHEFEALLFTQPAVIAEILMRPKLASPLERIRKSKNEYERTPEEINDSAATSPSARIETLCVELFQSKQIFQKPIHGPMIAERIGLQAIREQCPHFGVWLGKLEALNTA